MNLCHKLKFSNPAISLQLDGVNLWYFKLRLFDLPGFHSLKYLRFAKIQGLENLSLWQRLKSLNKKRFVYILNFEVKFLNNFNATIYKKNLGFLKSLEKSIKLSDSFPFVISTQPPCKCSGLNPLLPGFWSAPRILECSKVFGVAPRALKRSQGFGVLSGF